MPCRNQACSRTTTLDRSTAAGHRGFCSGRCARITAAAPAVVAIGRMRTGSSATSTTAPTAAPKRPFLNAG